MADRKNFQVKLGMFVTIGVALLIVAIYMIGKKQNLFDSTFSVSGIFYNVSGLQVGNNVRFSGISVGIVDNVEIVSDSTVRVDMVIQESARKFIKSDAKATIGSEGLMGNKIINIIPGTTKEPIQDQARIATVKPMDMDEILLSLKATADNAETITGNLSFITTNIREGRGTVGKLFSDSALAQNLDRTIVNLQTGTKGFSDNMSAAKSSFLLKPLFKKSKEEKEKEKAVKEKAEDQEKALKEKEEAQEKAEKAKRKEERKLEKEQRKNEE